MASSLNTCTPPVESIEIPDILQDHPLIHAIPSLHNLSSINIPVSDQVFAALNSFIAACGIMEEATSPATAAAIRLQASLMSTLQPQAPARIGEDLLSRMAQMMDTKLGKLSDNLTQQMSTLRNELRNEMGTLRNEMGTLRNEMGTLRNEMNDMGNKLRWRDEERAARGN
ncbi:hypothetical protein IAT40_005729 [Kwoniella sp. CBS 6097]